VVGQSYDVSVLVGNLVQLTIRTPTPSLTLLVGKGDLRRLVDTDEPVRDNRRNVEAANDLMILSRVDHGHRDDLVVRQLNEHTAQFLRAERARRRADAEAAEAHDRHVREAAARLRFDDSE
jgi:hypothetical protein